MQIEQLKAAGLGLAAIRRRARRRRAAGGRPAPPPARSSPRCWPSTGHQLATVDALLRARAGLARPALVHAPAVHAVTVRATCDPEDARSHGAPPRAAAAPARARVTAAADGVVQRPLPPRGRPTTPVAVEVAAHLAVPSPGGVTIPAETRLAVELIGPIDLLPLAYDALLDAGRERGLALGDVVVEHYLDLGAVGRTEVAIPVRDAA